MRRHRFFAACALVAVGAACEGPKGPEGVIPEPGTVAAADVTYSTTATTGGLVATNVQAALDEVALRNSFALPIFCGSYTNPAGTADLDGWIAARDACVTTCGSSPATVRPCSVEDVVRLIRAGAAPDGDLGWVFSGLGCNGLDDGSALVQGVFWQGTSLTNRTCESDGRLLCCR